MDLGVLTGTTGVWKLVSCISLLLKVRKIEVSRFYKFLRNADIYLRTRNPLIVQVGLISIHLDCLFEFEKLVSFEAGSAPPHTLLFISL